MTKDAAAGRRFLAAAAADLVGLDAASVTALLEQSSAQADGQKQQHKQEQEQQQQQQQQQQTSQRLETLTNLIQQAPLPDATRVGHLVDLGELRDVLLDEPGLVRLVDHLRSLPLRISTVGGAAVALPLLPPELTAVYETLFDLDSTVAEPWTLIGGLMVLTHCAEHGLPFSRATADADIAVSVFTHRTALQSVTSRLTALGFHDVTPEPLGGGDRLSYRYTSAKVKVDVAVPPKSNEQPNRATTADGRGGVELPATQQALRRTERLQLVTADGVSGLVRRPNLLGSVVIKATASIADSRDVERHQQDLVTLGDTMAFTGAHLRYAPDVTAKDDRRLRQALELLPTRLWRSAQDPEAARSALEYLLPSRR